MKIYGCKVRSLIDGGAPGYFIIGPFVNKDDADKITYIYNKLLDEKGQEYANYLSYILNTYGYHESDHGHATTVEIDVYDDLSKFKYINSSNTVSMIADEFDNKIKMEAERERLLQERIDLNAYLLYKMIKEKGYDEIKASEITLSKQTSFSLRVKIASSDMIVFDCIFNGSVGGECVSDGELSTYYVPKVYVNMVYRARSTKRIHDYIELCVTGIKNILLDFLYSAAKMKMLFMAKYDNLTQVYKDICKKISYIGYNFYNEYNGFNIKDITITVLENDIDDEKLSSLKIGKFVNPEDCDDIEKD